MNRYQVSGLDRENGQPRDLVVNAINEDNARNEAADAGIVVENMSLIQCPAQSNNQHPTKNKTELSSYRKSANRIGEMAIAVFIGLLLFSCVSPIIITFIISTLIYLGRNPGTPT